MAFKLAVKEVKPVIPKKQILSAGTRIDLAGHGGITKRILRENGAVKMNIKSEGGYYYGE
jgi:hypothetical protein